MYPDDVGGRVEYGCAPASYAQWEDERSDLQYHRLIVYQRVVEYDHLATKLLATVQRFDRGLADHLRRSGNSLITAIAEGASADQPKMKAASYRTAKREAEECSSCWEKPARQGWTPEAITMQLLGKLDEVARMLGQLIIRFDPHDHDGQDV